MKMMKILPAVLFLAAGVLAMPFAALNAQNANLKAGRKIEISKDYYFKYSFAQKPKVGTAVLKVKVYNAKDEQVENLAVTAEYDMPSMRGHHPSGVQAFKLNKKKDYLLPVHFAMRGDWAIDLTFSLDNETLYKGTINLDI